MALSAGTGRADITPPVGIAHANWGAQTHERAAGVDLPLWATALALSDGDETVAIVDLDLLLLEAPAVAAVTDAVGDLTGLPTSHVRLSYTHTHSGPTPRRETWVDGGTEMLDPYLDALPHRVAGAVSEALAALEPVRVSAGAGTCDIAVNRRFRRPEDGRVLVGRNPDGPVDREVGVVRIDGIDGEPVAAIANYACHPITVGPDSDLITPDYPGVTKRVVEGATGATCVFLQGAAGDVGPIRGCARNGIDEYRPLGRRLGHEVCRVFESIDPGKAHEEYAETVESGAPLAAYEPVDREDPDRALGVVTTEIDLPIKELPPPASARADLEERRERLRERRAAGADEEEIRALTFKARRAGIQKRLAAQYADRTHETVEFQAFSVGDDIVLAAVPGEPFVEIGRDVKHGSPYDHTLFGGYSNAGGGYVPTADQYDVGGYEVDVTPFAPGAAERLVEGAIDALAS